MIFAIIENENFIFYSNDSLNLMFTGKTFLFEMILNEIVASLIAT